MLLLCRSRDCRLWLCLLLLSSLLLSTAVMGQDTGALTLVPGQNGNDDDGVEIAVEENGVVEEDTKRNKEPMDIFRPTKEWQPVKAGQAIPAGLHVRMNLQTGAREAKLMEDDRKLKYWEFDGKRGMTNTDKKQFSREELKEALKDFKLETIFQDPPPAEEGAKKKFRNYKQLKKDLEKIQMKVKTEAEIVTELFSKLNGSALDEDGRRTILTDLEYYLHQVDNAQLFSDMGGMQLLLKFLNDSAQSIRSETAFALGSALQSNPKVQIAAMDVGLMPVLLRMLVTETTPLLRQRTLYALSGLVRQFPFAQQQLLKQGGLQAMASLFSPPNLPNLGVRAATLITDLLQEQEIAEKKLDPNESVNAERIHQYSEVKLKEGLLAGGWCELVLGLLDSQDLDVTDKVLSAMMLLLPECKTAFLPARPLLQQLSLQYKELSRQDPHPFHTRLLDFVTSLSHSLQPKDEL